MIRLVAEVAIANGCRSFWHKTAEEGCRTFLIGRPSDVNTARYLIGLLALEVKRLSKECTIGYPDKYRRDFKYGVVDAIAVKFAQQWKRTKEEVRAEHAHNPLALMRVDNALVKMEQRLATVDAFMKENIKLRDYKSQYKAGMTARAHGYMEGQTIEISKAKGAMGSGEQGIVKRP